MPVMQVRVVRVSVDHRRVPVPVAMRLAGRIVRPVRVLVMRVVGMAMFMLHRFMRVLMLMLMPLRKTQP